MVPKGGDCKERWVQCSYMNVVSVLPTIKCIVHDVDPKQRDIHILLQIYCPPWMEMELGNHTGAPLGIHNRRWVALGVSQVAIHRPRALMSGEGIVIVLSCENAFYKYTKTTNKYCLTATYLLKISVKTTAKYLI